MEGVLGLVVSGLGVGCSFRFTPNLKRPVAKTDSQPGPLLTEVLALV